MRFVVRRAHERSLVRPIRYLGTCDRVCDRRSLYWGRQSLLQPFLVLQTARIGNEGGGEGLYTCEIRVCDVQLPALAPSQRIRCLDMQHISEGSKNTRAARTRGQQITSTREGVSIRDDGCEQQPRRWERVVLLCD